MRDNISSYTSQDLSEFGRTFSDNCLAIESVISQYDLKSQRIFRSFKTKTEELKVGHTRLCVRMLTESCRNWQRQDLYLKCSGPRWRVLSTVFSPASLRLTWFSSWPPYSCLAFPASIPTVSSTGRCLSYFVRFIVKYFPFQARQSESVLILLWTSISLHHSLCLPCKLLFFLLKETAMVGFFW